MKSVTNPALDVLIVDDNKIDREAVKRSLFHTYGQGDLVVHEAGMGGAALQMLKDSRFDCVFLDYRLPDMDGLSLLKKIYDADAGLAKDPVVLLTGQGSENVMIEALRSGAQDYLSKDNITSATINIAMIKAREIFKLRRSWKQAEDRLHQAQKMEAVGQLTSGIAHDFNNLLTVILGNVHNIRRRIDLMNGVFGLREIQEKISLIESAANRGAELVRRLMVFTRQRAPLPQAVNINACIQDTALLLNQILGDGINVRISLAENLCMTVIDTGQLENAIINMVLNARDAMDGQGSLGIGTGNFFLDSGGSDKVPGMAAGQYVMLTVSDTGHGMRPDVAARIFEPFFTTKEAGKGSGLGLSMVYGFVKEFGGYIFVDSRENAGTTFRIYLPCIKSGQNEESFQENG
ncbi:MAG: response regulator [Micavibrio aeruginosavorus]|uniref:histidine kinase n=1 Tax=Micavibrio aeruginosavorus TaxID=349221 RepID=A0A7T5UGE9_9BACT|nr:MAG: response regulator [Micavibrio aeruginosavorus]